MTISNNTGGMEMRVCISSLKFSPAHVSHMIAYAKLFREIGFEPFLWLEKSYEKMDLTNEFEVVWYQGSIPDNADLLFFANNSLVNYKFFLVIILCLHKDSEHITYILECLEKKVSLDSFF